jgi:hypothetical protein
MILIVVTIIHQNDKYSSEISSERAR